MSGTWKPNSNLPNADSSFYRQQQHATPTPQQLPPNVFEVPVVGVTFDNRQAIIARLQVGENLELRRDPGNAHDRNAICVETRRGEQIGFIGKDLAVQLAPVFDAHGAPIQAVVTARVGGQLSGSALGVRIRFTAPQPVTRLPTLKDLDGDL